MKNKNNNKISLVFTDGKFDAKASLLPKLPPRVILQNWATANNPRTKIGKVLSQKIKKYLQDLANPFKTKGDGVFLYVPRNVKITTPMQILFLSKTKSSKPKKYFLNILIILEQGSQINWLEEYQTKNRSSQNINTEIYLQDNARINYTKLQNESIYSQHLANLKVIQNKHSQAEINHITIGGKQVTDNIQVNLTQPAAKCDLISLYLPSDKQTIHQKVHIQHLHQNCQSKTLAKGILSDCASATFKGRITVTSNSQYTEAQLLNKNLLLSKDAHVTTTPELEIYNDNVKCNHGATIGQLDEKALIYLRTRGLTEKQARNTLIHAFAAEIIDHLPTTFKKSITELIDKKI